MKKPYREKFLSLMSFTLFALLLAEAYLNHKEEIDESVARLKSVLNQDKPEEETAEISSETEEGVTENAQ